MTEFDVLRTSAEGMDAQRSALEVAAHNVAAAQTAQNGSFTRLIPRFTSSADDDDTSEGDDADEGFAAIRFNGTRKETVSDVDTVTEMVAVLNAQRAYEANASVFEDTKRLMERTIDLGRM